MLVSVEGYPSVLSPTALILVDASFPPARTCLDRLAQVPGSSCSSACQDAPCSAALVACRCICSATSPSLELRLSLNIRFLVFLSSSCFPFMGDYFPIRI